MRRTAPESPGCTICVFGEERLRHLPRFQTLLDRVPFELVAPSQFMADRWKLYFGREELDITVHEIGTVSEAPPESRRPGPPVASADRPRTRCVPRCAGSSQRLGRIPGTRAEECRNGNYRFYHFGDGRYRGADIERHEVSVGESEPLAVVDALRREGIDLAVVWSLWEESFSFTAHEALSAGAAILANESSGNIARVVRMSGDGLVFTDEQELFAAFENELIVDLVRSHVRRGQLPRILYIPG